MESLQKKALVMSHEEFQKNKEWLLQFPGAFCNPVIEQLERYLVEIPADESAISPTDEAVVADKRV